MTREELQTRYQAWQHRQQELAKEGAEIKAGLAALRGGGVAVATANSNSNGSNAGGGVDLFVQSSRAKNKLLQRPDTVRARAKRIRAQYPALTDPTDEFQGHAMSQLVKEALWRLLGKSGILSESWWPSERDLRVVSLFLSADKADLQHHRNHQLRVMAQQQLRLQKARQVVDLAELLNPANNPANRRISQSAEEETVVNPEESK